MHRLFGFQRIVQPADHLLRADLPEARQGLVPVAEQVLGQQRSGLAGVLLDMTMPSKSGYEVLRELRSTHADLPVVLMSGFEEADAAGRAGDVVPTGFLRKPFTADELLAAIRRLRAHAA